MIDIAAAQLCRAQRDKLYGCYRRNAGELRRERRKREYGICRIRGIFKVGSTKENRVTAPRTNLGNVSRGLCVVKRVGGERRKDSSALDERQCSVLQLSCGICLAVNIVRTIKDRLNSENWKDSLGMLGNIGSGHDTTLASRVLQDHMRET